MKTLKTYGSPYEEFCKTYKKETLTKNNTPKAHIRYGAEFAKEINKDMIVFCMGGVSGKNRIESHIQKIVDTKQYSVENIRVIVPEKNDIEKVDMLSKEKVVHGKSAEAYLFYATAGTIVTDTLLPQYFIRKKEQRVVYLYSEEQNKLFSGCAGRENLLTLLKTSEIVIDKPESIEYLSKDIVLADIYKGKIVGLFEEDSEDSFVKYLLEEEYDKNNCFTLITDKKKVLLYYDYNKDAASYVSVKRLLENVDYEKYNITLVSGKIENGTPADTKMSNLNENVRVITRSGTFSADSQEYIDIQFMIRNIPFFEELENAMNFVNKKTVQREIRRVLGDMDFDSFLYIGEHDNVWSMLSTEIPAKKKKKILFSNLKMKQQFDVTPKGQNKFNNQIKICNMYFDHVVFESEYYAKIAVDNGFFDKNIVETYSFPVWKEEVVSAEALNTVILENRQYGVFVREDVAYRRHNFEMVLMPEAGKKCYITNGKVANLDRVLQTYATICNENNMLYIYAVDPDEVFKIAGKYDLQNNIKVIYLVKLEDYPVTINYLKAFDGYLTTEDNEDFCTLRNIMENQNQDVLFIEDNNFVKKSKKLFDSKDNYKSYCISKMVSLLG